MAILDVLREVVLACGELVISLREEDQGVVEKNESPGQHFSTTADRESLKKGLSIFSRAMPAETIVAEEQENAREIPPDCTVFDPLDGTTNFFNGLDEFGVTACTLRTGQTVCSATYFPVRNMLITAEKDKGCWVLTSGCRVPMPIEIYWHGVMDKTQIGTDVGSWSHKQKVFDLVLKPLSQRFNMLSAMAAVEGGRRVLLGQTGVYYNLGIAKIWDAAAMALAVQEAGGVACDPYGNPLRWDNVNCDWVLAVNQGLADLVLEYTHHWPGRLP
ncbi:MAG: inositol monophosphatase family protein [Patescibacteria group bacterium]